MSSGGAPHDRSEGGGLAQAARARLPGALRTTWDVLVDTSRRFRDHNGTAMAAAVAMYTIVSLVPVALLAVAGFGAVLGAEQAQERVIAFINDNLPGASERITDVLRSVSLPQHRVFVYIVAIFGLLWAATNLPAKLSLFMTIAWTGRPGRGFLGRRLIALAVIVLSGILFLISVALTSIVTAIARNPDRFGILSEAVSRLAVSIGWLFSFLFVVGLLFLLYRLLPAAPVMSRAAALGAVTGAVLLHLLRAGFNALIVSSGRYGEIYGSLAGIIVLLLWIYYSTIVVLFCAALAAAYQHRMHEPGDGGGAEAGAEGYSAARSP